MDIIHLWVWAGGRPARRSVGMESRYEQRLKYSGMEGIGMIVY